MRKTVDCYTFDRNGFFSGVEKADESEAEPGVFLMPPNATLEPPPVDFGAFARWVGQKWICDFDKLAAAVRVERNRRLAATDWTVLPDVIFQKETNEGLSGWYSGWIDYRQRLRDLPAQKDFPTKFVFPDAPNFKSNFGSPVCFRI